MFSVRGLLVLAGRRFFFFIFLKNKNFKNIYSFWNISKIPPVAPIGRQILSIIFFFKFATRSLKKKGACRPPTGDRRVAPPLGRPLGPAYGRGRGACRPPRATGVSPYKSSSPPLPSSFEPENSTKNPEMCLVYLVYIFFHLSTRHLSRSNLSRGE